MRYLVLIVLILLSAVAGSRSISATDLTINGHYKNFSIGYDAPHYGGLADADQKSTTGMINNRIRLNFIYQATDCLSLRISYALMPRIQDRLLAESTAAGETTRFPTYRLADFDSTVFKLIENAF